MLFCCGPDYFVKYIVIVKGIVYFYIIFSSKIMKTSNIDVVVLYA